MSYDPRRQRIATIMQMIKQNPYVANKNSMIKPLYEEVIALGEKLDAANAEIKKLKAAPKKASVKKEKTDGDATTK